MTTELKDNVLAEILNISDLSIHLRDSNYRPDGHDGLEVSFDHLNMFSFEALTQICKKHNCFYYLNSPVNNLIHRIKIRPKIK